MASSDNEKIGIALGAQEFCVKLPSLPEAPRMLADWAGMKETSLLPAQANFMAQECGYLPLALAMIYTLVC